MRTSIAKTSSVVFAIRILEDLNHSSSTDSDVVKTVFHISKVLMRSTILILHPQFYVPALLGEQQKV